MAHPMPEPCDLDTDCEFNKDFNPHNEWDAILEKARQAGLPTDVSSVPKATLIPIGVEMFKDVAAKMDSFFTEADKN
jgi:hypothetical protein